MVLIAVSLSLMVIFQLFIFKLFYHNYEYVKSELRDINYQLGLIKKSNSSESDLNSSFENTMN